MKRATHLKQFIAGVEISSLLEGGCHSGGKHLVSGRWVSWHSVVGHKHILRREREQIHTHKMHLKLKLTQTKYFVTLFHNIWNVYNYFDFITTVAGFVLVVHLDKRVQVVFQPLLMTSGHYMYDHTEHTEQGTVILGALQSVSNSRNCSHILHRWSTDRRELTAISWASLVAAVSTSNSCISTVGRKLTITWVSMACRHYGGKKLGRCHIINLYIQLRIEDDEKWENAAQHHYH